MSDQDDVLLATRRPLRVTFLAIFLVTMCVWVLSGRTANGEWLVLEQLRSGWKVSGALIFFLVFVVVMIPRAIFEKTVFLSTCIRQRTWSPSWQQFQYGDVTRVHLVPKRRVEIHFRDGKKLEVGSAYADLAQVSDIVLERAPNHTKQTVWTGRE